MATHLGLTCVPKGAGSSFAGKTENDAVPSAEGPYSSGLGPTRIMPNPKLDTIATALLLLGLTFTVGADRLHHIASEAGW